MSDASVGILTSDNWTVLRFLLLFKFKDHSITVMYNKRDNMPTVMSTSQE